MKTSAWMILQLARIVLVSEFLVISCRSDASQSVERDAQQMLSAGGQITLPAGTYAIKQTAQIAAHTQITCAPGAVITDVGTMGSLVILKGPGIRITGCKFFVRSRPLILMLAAGVSDLTLRNNSLESSNHALGILIDAPGVHDIFIIGNRFDGLDFGILQNTQAGDLINMDIEGNSFTNLKGDGVELNNPSDSVCCGKRLSDAKASKVLIKNNSFDIPLPPSIDSRAEGFCVGIAGAHDIVVQHNRCKTWYQGIHIEDKAFNISVIDNSITTNDPSDFAYQAGVWVIDGHDIDIQRNTITDALGDGIRIDYDPVHQATSLKIMDNIVRNCRRAGISIEAGSVGPIKAEVAGNTVEKCKISIRLAGPLRDISLHDNKLAADRVCPIEFGGMVDKSQIHLSRNSLSRDASVPLGACTF